MNKKVILIIGAILLGLGVIMLITGAKLFGWGLIILSIVFEVIGFASMALVGASKAATDGAEENFDVRLNSAITKVRQDKFKAEGDIRRMKSWACDAILSTYGEFYPDGSLAIKKDTLLDTFEDIKKEHELKLSFETSDKCNRVVGGYKNQIGLRESQMQLLDKLSAEYAETKKRYDIAKNKSKKLDKLDAHDKRLQEMDGNSNALADTMMHQYKLEDVKKEFALKEAYITQLEQLQYQYGDDSNFDNAVAYKKEVDKMLVTLN